MPWSIFPFCFYAQMYKMLPTTYTFVIETYYETNENSADT